MAFKKGHEKKGGRKKGSVNGITKTVKETLLCAFNNLQADPKANLLDWGRNNPTPFYQIAAKLIPTEISGAVDVTMKGIDKIEIVHTK